MSQTAEEIKEMFSCASLHRDGCTIERSADKTENEVAAQALKILDSAYYKGKKTILDPKIGPWQEINSIKNYALKWWDYNTMPYLDGQRLFLRSRRDELWAEVASLDAQIKAAAAKLDERKSEILSWARATFGPTFDESLYPKSWVEKFAIRVKEHNMDPPKYLERKDSEEYKRELQRTLKDIEYGMRQFERQCFAQMGESAAALASNLGKGHNNGLGANVDGFRKLFNRVAQMKFEGTAAFRRAMKEAQDILDGVTADDLRHDKGLRVDVKERVEKMIAKYHEVQEAARKKAAKEVA
jgi:hypothetical protein